jgi:hypothetical protein
MPVNRMSLEGELPFGGNWPGSNRGRRAVRPVELGSYPVYCRPQLGIKSSRSPCSLGQDLPPLLEVIRAALRPPEIGYALSVVGSTWTPGPMVELTATRLT